MDMLTFSRGVGFAQHGRQPLIDPVVYTYAFRCRRLKARDLRRKQRW